jgi:predicted 3-demethylubiquinone-9 3-methyltransferase (glyoxalase superfamily)
MSLGGWARSIVVTSITSIATRSPVMTQVTPFLWYDGDAEEAIRYYVSVIPDSQVTGISHYGPGMPYPEGSVMTVSFTLAGRPYTALNGGPVYQFTEAISLAVSAAGQAEVDRLWDALTDGGKPGPCGWLKDRWGLSWQVVPDELPGLLSDPSPLRSAAAAQAMLSMSKLDIAAMRAAADAAAPAGG